jgi:RHS repeat-associated protein
VAATANYGYGATPAIVAQELADGAAGNSLVTVTAVNDALYIESKTAGAGTDYTYSVQNTGYNHAFSQPSFPASTISDYLDGGADGSTGQNPTTVYSFAGSYDGVGNLTGYTDSVMGAWNFNYDSLNRLVSSAGNQSGNPITNYCWGYDAFGNRTIQAGSSAAFQTGSPTCAPASGASFTSTWANYNDNNRFTATNQAPGGVPYDASGNVTNDGQNQYLYDGEGRICAVASTPIPGMTAMTGYLYDADGTRVAKGRISAWSCDPAVNGFQTTSDYILGPGGQQVTEMAMDANNSMAWQHTNVYAGGKLLGTYDVTGLHFYFDDPLGTRRAQTDYAGVIERTCASLPFGDGETCTPTPTEHLFTGKERDTESGNDYFGARYYASSMGRFMSPDPSAGYYANPMNPQTLNLYSYGLNNPLVNIDPTGLDCAKNNGDGTVTLNTGDCANESEDAANHEYYIDCDGCTANAQQASLDKPTGSLSLFDSTGNLIAPAISGWADPQSLSTSVTVDGGTNGDVTMSGFGVPGGLEYMPLANFQMSHVGYLVNPDAPPSLPKLKGKDRALCLWGGMTNEMLGGNSGPSDSNDTAPGKGGAGPVQVVRTYQNGNERRVGPMMGVDEGNGAKADAYTLFGNYFVNMAACFLNNLSR